MMGRATVTLRENRNARSASMSRAPLITKTNNGNRKIVPRYVTLAYLFPQLRVFNGASDKGANDHYMRIGANRYKTRVEQGSQPAWGGLLDSHANTVTTPHLEECNSNK